MVNDYSKTFGDNIYYLMELKDVSYRVLARGTGIAASSINEYVHHKHAIPLNYAALIARYFNTTVDEMTRPMRKDVSNGRKKSPRVSPRASFGFRANYSIVHMCSIS